MSAPSSQPQHYAYIHALRGIAILGVVMVHCTQSVENLPEWLRIIAAQGRYGVQLFFVVSAVTLTLSLKSRSRSELRPLQNYFIRRWFRIAPLYYFGLLLYATIDRMSPPEWPWHTYSAAAVTTNLLFVHGFFPSYINNVVPGGWSIAVEMSFYVLLPAILWFTVSLSRTLLSIGFGIVFSFAAAYLLERASQGSLHVGTSEYFYVWLPSQIPVFLIGVAAYFLIKKSENSGASSLNDEDVSWINKIHPGYWLVAFVVILPLSALAGKVSILWAPPMYGLAFACLTIGLSRYPLRLLVNSWTCKIGELSFSIYILHFTFAWVLVPRLARGLTELLPPTVNLGIIFVVTLAVSSGAAWLTYKFLEQPGIALGRRLIAHNEKRQSRS
jgi:peptidoglycan/LPS O-acetylase OafA/YrhL